MRTPLKILSTLTTHSKCSGYKFERLYRILFNQEMFFLAYQGIYAKPGNMTPGSDGQTIDGMNLSQIEKIIDSLKDETYQPQPSRRMYIRKKNGKLRPLGIPGFNDKLVQEVIRMVLEAIYEDSFEDTSHGFRPHRSCHTALSRIQNNFSGVNWFIEGDIKGFFDNIDHEVLIRTLRERIIDERFIRLIRKFLNAGYMENGVFHKTYSGTPQGGIISPILANIYLDKLDKYVKTYINTFDRGNKRKPSRARMDFENRYRQIKRKLTIADDEKQRAELIQEFRILEKERIQFPSGDEFDADYRRLKYVRYADDFLIGIIGSKADAKSLKEDIKNFLYDQLSLELSEEKTLVTHTENSAEFLGYEIFVTRSNLTKRDKLGRLRRVFNKKIYLKLNTQILKKKLIEYGAMTLKVEGGKELWKPRSRPRLIFNDDLEILDRYNREIRGVYNYYAIANNCSEVSNFCYIMQCSMYKTFAGKYRTFKTTIIRKYLVNGLFTVRFKLKGGITSSRHFWNKGFKRKIIPNEDARVDRLPKTIGDIGRTSLIDRLKAEKCELCEANGSLVMHHVRKLTVMQGKESWERHMIARQRKTIAVCRSCHARIHMGTLRTGKVNGEAVVRRDANPIRGRTFRSLPAKREKVLEA